MTASIDTDADLRRMFWALFLDSKVESDGQVPGLCQWCTDNPGCFGVVHEVAMWAAVKIRCDGRDVSECLQAGVRYAREQMRKLVPHEQHPVSGEEVQHLIDTLAERLAWNAPREAQRSGLAAMMRLQLDDRRQTRLTEEQVAEARRQAAEIRAREVGQ